MGLVLTWGVYAPKNSKLTQEKLFSVENGQNLVIISKNLQKKSLIINKFFFYLFLSKTFRYGHCKLGDIAFFKLTGNFRRIH